MFIICNKQYRTSWAHIRPRCRKSNNIMVEFVEIEVVNIQFTEIGQVIIELYYNIELIERKTCI